jgi:hypothetical protein
MYHTAGYLLHYQQTLSVHAETYGYLLAVCQRTSTLSQGGLCIFLGQNLISWSYRKQATMARSNTGAEYKALANVALEITWLRSLLKELDVPTLQATLLCGDDIGATYLSSNPVFHAYT